MNKKSKYLGFLIGFCASILFLTPTHAQRAGTTVDRNEDAREINELYKQGKWEEGKAKAEGFLAKNPKDSDMRMLLGKYLIHRQQFEKARFELVKSLQYAPANVDAKHMLVTVEAETGRYSSAICYVNELLEVNPYWKGLWRTKIDLYRRMGNHVEADRLLTRISQIYPEDQDLRNDRAYQLELRTAELVRSGNVDQATEAARRMVAEQPGEPDAYLSVIDNYIKAGDYHNALVYADRALNQFPGNGTFVQKKIAVLEHQQRYSELFAFIEAQMRAGASGLRSQYDYLLLEGARHAKNNDPANLYGRIFEQNPGNREAFDYVFNDQIGKAQYEEALAALYRHRMSVGGNKELDMKELMVYRRMQNTAQVAALTKRFFNKYPNDTDLRDAYVVYALQSAKNNSEEGKITQAIADWQDVIRYGDDESVGIARRGIYNAYVATKRYPEAIVVLGEMLLDDPNNPDLLLKKSDLYHQQSRYDYALSIYEDVIERSPAENRERLVVGYGEMVATWVKELRAKYELTEARRLLERWLAVDEYNQDALLAMINIHHQLRDYDAMLRYAQVAEEHYSKDVAFKIKLAEAMNRQPDRLNESWALLHRQVQQDPFHEPLLNTFVYTTEEYAAKLLKDKDHAQALTVLDTALSYKDDYKVLKYMKGLAYEGLKNYDSAYYYQQFHEPSLMEYEEFKYHLDALANRTYRNHVGVAHLRARFGESDAITTISTAEYSRIGEDGSIYTGRVNYTGRETGKGVQGQLEWTKPWTSRLSTRLDGALSNKFFAKVQANAAAIYEWRPTWEAEAGIGFRNFYSADNLFNLNLGVTKTFDSFRLNGKVSNFLLDSEGERFYLYNATLNARYYMSNPRNYVMAIGSVGSSPDVDLLDNQLYNSFNVFNAMVGAGLSRSLSRHVSVAALGTWYNFQTDRTVVVPTYKNLYNLYLQINISF